MIVTSKASTEKARELQLGKELRGLRFRGCVGGDTKILASCRRRSVFSPRHFGAAGWIRIWIRPGEQVDLQV